MAKTIYLHDLRLVKFRRESSDFYTKFHKRETRDYVLPIFQLSYKEGLTQTKPTWTTKTFFELLLGERIENLNNMIFFEYRKLEELIEIIKQFYHICSEREDTLVLAALDKSGVPGHEEVVSSEKQMENYFAVGAMDGIQSLEEHYIYGSIIELVSLDMETGALENKNALDIFPVKSAREKTNRWESEVYQCDFDLIDFTFRQENPEVVWGSKDFVRADISYIISIKMNKDMDYYVSGVRYDKTLKTKHHNSGVLALTKDEAVHFIKEDDALEAAMHIMEKITIDNFEIIPVKKSRHYETSPFAVLYYE